MTPLLRFPSKPTHDDAPDAELLALFQGADRGLDPDPLALDRMQAKVAAHLERGDRAPGGLRRRLALGALGLPAPRRPRGLAGLVSRRIVAIPVVVTALALVVAFAALTSDSGSASAGFLQDVEALATATDDALMSGDLSETERTDLIAQIVALAATLEGDPDALAELDPEQLAEAARSSLRFRTRSPTTTKMASVTRSTSSPPLPRRSPSRMPSPRARRPTIARASGSARTPSTPAPTPVPP